MRVAVDRVRAGALIFGCALLFWQLDAAPADWVFGIAIVVSLLVWEGGVPGFELAWPQPLLLVFLTITALTTTLASGSVRFLAITVYLALLALVVASTLRRDPRRVRWIELALVVAGASTAVMVILGAMAWNLGLWQVLNGLSADPLRGKGMFRDANVAGAFVACAYPLAAAYCLRLRRARMPLVLLVTALFGAGVVYSYSRLALGLFVLALAAVMVVVAASRERRVLLGIGACVLVAVGAVGVAVASGRFPLFRYEPIQDYDANGRFVAWLFGAQMVREAPLGSGSGTFEARTQAYSEEQLKRERFSEDGSGESPNLIRDGALARFTDWWFDRAIVTASLENDGTSVTQHAVRKVTSDKYQDVVQSVPVTGGRTYSFAAQIRTDGTPALLIIHWYDVFNSLIGQAGTEPVTSATWTEAQLLSQTAPPSATRVLVFLANREAGEQYFTAIRMVAGPTVPAWSSAMQWGTMDSRAPGEISAHNSYLRVAVESGLPGLVAFVGYWIVLLRRGWSLRSRAWQWPVAFSLVLLAGFAIDTLHWRVLWIYGGVIAALWSETSVRLSVPQAAPSVGFLPSTRRTPVESE